MHIAFVDVTCTRSYGGVQTAVWQLAGALVDLGHRVSIFGGEADDGVTITADLGAREVAVHTFPFTRRQRFPNFGTRFRKLAERWSFARQARAALTEAAPDWVVLTKPFDFIWPAMLPAGSKTRFAFMSGGTDFFPGDRHFAKQVAVMLACSQFNAWQIYSRYKRPVRPMWNGVDIDRFSPLARDAQLRQSWGVADHEVLFAFAGRLVGWKGLHLAVRALATPALQALPVKLLLIGGGEAKAGLQALASELGVAGRVIFVPPQPHGELPRLYASADAGVFPSIGDEAFGITIAEAMACALPVVASYNGGIPEVIGNEGSCGRLCTLADVPALAAAMAELAGSASLRQQLGAAARQRIVSNYTWRAAATRLLDAMQEAAA